mgnify:CR=1 FL=1
MKRIAPSFLSADIWRISQQITALEQAGCSILHLDVMDWHFVPNLSFGAEWIKGLRPHTQMIFDTHLMMEAPDAYLPAVKAAGSAYCTVHAEATRHLDRSLRLIRELGMKPGVSLNPATPLSAIEEVLELCDLVLIMSVNPGFGGQKFIPYSYDRISRLAALRDRRALSFLIQVDGGVTADNAHAVAQAGADILVAGSAIFGQPDLAAAYQAIHEAANR